MKILMRPSPGQLERLGGASPTHPQWFAAPLIAAAGDNASFCHSLSAILFSGRSVGGAEPALVFNVGRLEAALALIPLRLRLCSLYQWHPMDQMGAAKRYVYQQLLAKSKVIATYSKITQGELERRFAGKPVRWLGLFTDTDFFDPAKTKVPPGDFLLCPGDHKRIEHVVSHLAHELGIRVVRFSSGPETATYYSQNPNPLVEVLSGIPFSQVRDLYQSARIVLNVADDRFWPVGITTFCEALAMNKVIVTSGGHSCSGYEFQDGTKPYFTVRDCYDRDEWLRATKSALGQAIPWQGDNSPRRLAEQLCSFESTMVVWGAILDLLGR
ncbi:MAG: hypothetical protein M0Z50_11800 [Planctomycetia bacterium]|nr:hypothetical protein [Planctomycetia bacterium]